MTNAHPLLAAVDVLTKPERSKVIQERNGITCISVVDQPALLDRLVNAIRSSMGKGTPGASLAFEGAPLNTAALYEAMKITAQIGDWCRIVGVVATRNPTTDLRAWYVATLPRNLSNEVQASHIRHLKCWADTIEGMLDPPREKDLPDSCPVCGASEWWRDGERFPRPLVIRYKPEEPVGSATALCKACEKVWTARELAYELEQKEQTG